MRSVLFLITPLLISGCVSTYTHTKLSEPPGKLQKNSAVAIATPSNGFYESKEYRSSGTMTANSVRAAFAPFTSKSTVSQNCEDVDCLKNKYPSNYAYYVVPVILHWEDRATEWSMIPDKIEIKLTIYDAITWEEMASTIVAGKSKIMTMGGDHPQDLLNKPIKEYISSLY